MNFHYHVTYQSPNQRLIHITCSIKDIHQNTLEVHLPAWRPGRYEIGNFAKNILYLNVFSNTTKISAQKINKDCWQINTENINNIEISYAYYAAEWNAGSSFICDSFLYVNPVNCCLFAVESLLQPCSLSLSVPDTFQTAISKDFDLHSACYNFNDFHDLADTPFISGTTLQCLTYTCANTPFSIWFNGIINDIPSQKIIDDFKAFTQAQYDAFGSFPFKSYHFYIHVLPYRAYHGVEHLESTVITLGSAEKIFTDYYEDLLGISSHELYHAWNVKTIRPAAMTPYDYTKENYTSLGYITEGITTYMGDQMLLRSLVFTRDIWKKTFDELLEKHFQNFGRFNYSVAESSFDTWLDGYQAGVPNRKVSIYTEGALCAFMIDILIRKHSQNQKSLDDVMQWLYIHIAKLGQGYTALDYQNALEIVSGVSFLDFFNHYYNGVQDYMPLLKECLHFIGYSIETKERSLAYETFWGLKLQFAADSCTVLHIYPGSELEHAGIAIGDELIKVEHATKLEPQILSEISKSELATLIFKDILKQEKKITLAKGNYFKNYFLTRQHEMSEEQARHYALWAGVTELV